MTAESSLWKLIHAGKPTRPDRALQEAARDASAVDGPGPADAPDPTESAAAADDGSPVDVLARLRDAALDPTPGPAPAQSESTPLPEPDGWTDQLSGASGPKYWERVVANEEARRQRYGRTATVALVDLVGFEDERTFLGRDLLRSLFTRVARVMVREVRTSDHIARIGKARFGIILVETDEVRAINFVDRLRTMLLVELGPDQYFTAHIGWASPAEGGSMEDAIASAAERLGEDSRGKG